MSQDNNQERRQLPRRASRGVRNSQTEQQRKQDDDVYNRIFGNLDESSEEDSSFQELGLRPMQAFTANFANYNYGRGYHYFFNLDTFPRVEGAPSYALDDKNRFNFTYSRDQQQINGTKLKKILNRHYIGLPTIRTTYGNSKNKDKNVCHYHLFNTQDKKYYNHRLISKYKYILNHFDDLCQSGKIKSYTQLRKDVLMHEVCQIDTSIERKKQILLNRIKVLQERVKNMAPHWDWQDNIYFHFSLDQSFHNQALAKGQMLTQRNLKQRIFDRILSRKKTIEGLGDDSVILGAQKPGYVIENWIFFQQQEKKSHLSQQIHNRLKNSLKMIEMFRKKEELVTFPLFLFNLGDAERAVDSLLKAKLQKEHESEFYIYKAFIKKLFRRDLLCQDEALNQPILVEQYAKIMKLKLTNVKNFYEDQPKPTPKDVFIDRIVDLDKIEKSPVDERVCLLKQDHKVQITLKDLMLLFFYRNISIALTQFFDYINSDPEILKLMVNSEYEKYHYGIANVIRQQEFCIILNDIERLAQILNTHDIGPEFDSKLYFNFNRQLRVAYVWTQNDTDEWETDKESQEELHADQNGQDNSMRDVFQNGDPQPSKKLKID